VLPWALNSRIGLHVLAGELAAAASLVEELEAVLEATGNETPPYGALALAAWQGREAQASELIDASMPGVLRRGEGMGLAVFDWATAVLCTGLGRYEDALAAAERASAYPRVLWFSAWGSVELIEAAARSGQPELATRALRRLSETTRASGTDWALGTEACSRALLSDGEDAERLYREGIDRLERTRLAPCLGRAHLLYGEWLRRERRRIDARGHLRTAHEMLAAMGVQAFAERAERELLATGETARKRTVETGDDLTPQEARIAQLARDGLSNPEIGARLFISPRTVEYHLSKVFSKLDITSRAHLDRVLPAKPDLAA
jgi:DNA-binding CsgD family transcriptional regulator